FEIGLKSTFCTCILVGQNHARIHHNAGPDPDMMSGWCFGWCALTSCTGFGWVLQLLDRQEMRQKYDLQGSSCGACCTSFCCSCCEAIQTSKELDYLQISQTDGGYQAHHEKMVPQPQQQHPM
ncbi:PLAC8 family-domain-containing protein, partial [Tricladium varicosporioides]